MYRIRVITGSGFTSSGKGLTAISFAESGTIDYAVRQFGGVTRYDHDGSWKDGANQTITERGITFEVITTSPLQSNDARAEVHLDAVWEQARAFAEFVKSAFQQSAVVLTVDVVTRCKFV